MIDRQRKKQAIMDDKEKYFCEIKQPKMHKNVKNAFRLLELLKSGKRMKSDEIVEKLGISKRMVNYYKNTLLTMGYNISAYGGYEGGYQLIPPKDKLTNEELEYLEDRLNDNKFLMDKIRKNNNLF